MQTQKKKCAQYNMGNDSNVPTGSLSESYCDPNDSSDKNPEGECNIKGPPSPTHDLSSTNSRPTKIPPDLQTEELQQDLIKLETEGT